MPVPTDTLWNIRRLNKVFAISALVMLGTMGWAVYQDYAKTWRKPQQEGKVWEAALVDAKISRLDTEQRHKQAAALEKRIEAVKADLENKDVEYKKSRDEVDTLKEDIAREESPLNNLKATVGVTQARLENARTAGDTQRVQELLEELKGPAAEYAKAAGQLADDKQHLQEKRAVLAGHAARLDQLLKQKKDLDEQVGALRKREEALEPTSITGRLSNIMRRTPLMQFLNPAEKVTQVVLPDVLTDVSFTKIETTDRCMTCHVHADKKDFSAEKVIAFLEAQVAADRKYVYRSPNDPKAKATDPTADKPGVTAMPEFWHFWGRKILSDVSLQLTAGKVNGMASATSKGDDNFKVTFEGVKLADAWYNKAATTRPSALDEKARARQDGEVAEVLKALMRVSPNDAKLSTPRNLALLYPEQMRTLLQHELTAVQFRSLMDRYRFALTAEVNVARAQRGEEALDPSPVQLAHPNLALYVGVDSPHSIEAVGCTSCHDGSGQETDFVLAAHAPRPIWVDEKSGEPVLPQQVQKTAAAEERKPPTLDNMLMAVYPADNPIPRKVSLLHVFLEGDTGAGAAKGEAGSTTRPAEAAGAAMPAQPASAVKAELATEALLTPREIEVPADAPTTPYVDPVTGAHGRAVPQGRYWAKKYEAESGTTFEAVNEMWDFPMRPPAYLQANCARCHNSIHDVKEDAPVLYEGRMLFAKLGCVNCHQMDSVPEDDRRKVGTDLRNVTGKLSPAYINTWIWAPKAFRPSTLMPHFFMLENSSSDEEIRRTRQETRAITEYLVVAANKDWAPVHIAPPSFSGSAEKGKILFTTLGCQGCHTNLNDVGEKWITTDLEKRFGFTKKAAQGKFDTMTYNERQMYALENLGEVSAIAEQPKYADGTPQPIFMHHGPELSGIGDKLTAGRTLAAAKGWLFDWLKEPRHYSDYTVMPRLRLTNQEAMDLMEYLLAQHRTTVPTKDASGKVVEDVWHAEEFPVDPSKIAELIGFFLRSQYSDATAKARSTDPAEMSTRAADALEPVYMSRLLADDESFKNLAPEKQKPLARANAEKEVAGMTLEQKQLVFLGSKLIASYGCMNCHAINGMESIASPCTNLSDWGQKRISMIDFAYLDEHKQEQLPEGQIRAVPMVNGLSPQCVATIDKIVDNKEWTHRISADVHVAWPKVEHERTAFLMQKLFNPRIFDRGRSLLDPVRQYDNGKLVLDANGNPVLSELGKPYEKLKMPLFYLNKEQAHAIVTFVISNRNRNITPRLLAQVNNDAAMQIARGRQITERYNCVSCHQVESNFPAVRQYFQPDVWNTKTPPSLRGEGNKIQPSWLFGFLHNVELIRPLIFMSNGIRMPSFPITDDEAAAVAAYFAAASNRESGHLKKDMEAVDKYVTNARQASTQPTTQPDKAWPGDDWYSQDIFAEAVGKLTEWGLANKQITPGQLDPGKNSPTELGRNYRELRFKAQFTQELYDTPYPFVEVPAALVEGDSQSVEAHFKLGEKFFYEMQCLKCHVLGDPEAPGGNKAPTAPNLALAHRRLQRRWIGHWVQEPPIIQVGTAMPTFFSGLPVFDLKGQPWPVVQPPSGGDAEVKRIENTYGKTATEEKNLLLDYLFTAGAKPGYTAILPPPPAAPPAPAAAPDAGSDATAPATQP